MVGCRFPAVGIGGAIATLTVLITDGFVGVKSLGRWSFDLAQKSARIAASSASLIVTTKSDISVAHNVKRGVRDSGASCVR